MKRHLIRLLRRVGILLPLTVVEHRREVFGPESVQ
jgi:hypothetical protein